MLKLLHTSDWHLGRTLYGKKRYEEFAAFLHWLIGTLNQHQVAVLLVAGDVFDTGTPSNRAQELYYNFLRDVGQTCCRHVVIIAGNHDSPAFLDAPKQLLQRLDIHVVGAVSAELATEVLLLRDPAGAPELIVCAVPYLRDRDIRLAEAGESSADKERKLLEGIRSHYAQLGAWAQQYQTQYPDLPIVATGHLFTAGGQTLEGDGVRELYVGSLAHVGPDIFPAWIDYLALGHLHVPQKVGGSETRRYSGSPLPMGFGEARQRKSVCLVTLLGKTPQVELIEVPVFQRLTLLQGDLAALEAQLAALVAAGHPAWLEVSYTGETVVSNLREHLEARLGAVGLEILRVKSSRNLACGLQPGHEREVLAELDVTEVFRRCLHAYAVPEAQWPALLETYQETLHALHDAPPAAPTELG